jgi:hypothetical protein
MAKYQDQSGNDCTIYLRRIGRQPSSLTAFLSRFLSIPLRGLLQAVHSSSQRPTLRPLAAVDVSSRLQCDRPLGTRVLDAG